MGDGCKDTLQLAAEYESYSSGEEFEDDMRQYESSATESDGSDSCTVAYILEEGVTTGKDGSLVDSDDTEDEILEAEQMEALQVKSQQPSRLERPLRLQHSRGAADLTCSAACTSLNAAISCRRVMYATCNAITEGKRRVDKALQNAKKAGEVDESNRYSVLASKYDAALKLANGRARLINAVAECVENADMTDTVQRAQTPNGISTAAQIAKMPTESLAERFAAVHCAAVSNMAAIVAYKAEYFSMKAMKTCCENLDLENVETKDPTRSSVDTSFRRQMKNVITWFGIAVCIFCISFLAAVSPYTNNREHRNFIVTGGGILISIPLCFLFCQISVYCRKAEVKPAKKNIISQIDDRICQLHSYFVNNNITPFNSEKKQKMFGCINCKQNGLGIIHPTA